LSLIYFIQADQYGQYLWAKQHTRDGWRERYRKHQALLDPRIAEIVEGNPPAPDGMGRYRSRRLGKLSLDDEDTKEFPLDAEAVESPTDNDDKPVVAKRARNEEEDEEDEEVKHRSRAGPTTSSTGTRRKVSPPSPPVLKQHRAARALSPVAPSPDDADLTILGIDDDADEGDLLSPPQPQHVAAPPPPSLPHSRMRSRRRAAGVTAAPMKTTTHRRAAAQSKATLRRPQPGPSSSSLTLYLPATDEFVVHSDDDSEEEEVKANLALMKTTTHRRAAAQSKATLRRPQPGPSPSSLTLYLPATDEFVVHSDDDSEEDEVKANLHRETGDSATHSLSGDDLQMSMSLLSTRHRHDKGECEVNAEPFNSRLGHPSGSDELFKSEEGSPAQGTRAQTGLRPPERARNVRPMSTRTVPRGKGTAPRRR
jgi:hypothetical protein